MKRPYIFCHMMTALDGKIMGNFMDTREGQLAGDVFYQLAFGKNPYYQHQGWLSGRITTDDNFTFYEQPDLDEAVTEIEQGDFIPSSSLHMYYVSIDPSGKLGWKQNTITYVDTTARVLEVLTEKSSPAYRAFLRRLNIPYIIAGSQELDYALALHKLHDLFGIETLMLGGGGILNWSFIQAGLCDELSLVIASSADGSHATPALFSQKEGLTDDTAVSFVLEQAQVMQKNSVWLRYKIKKNKE